MIYIKKEDKENKTIIKGQQMTIGAEKTSFKIENKMKI